MTSLRTLVAALGLALAVAGAGPAVAVEPDEKLDDPKLEDRAQELSEEIRCVVCQSESISNSNADLAKDLRVLVREKIKAGQSDEEIKDFLTARYGDFVLLKPPMKPETYVLWYGPAAVTLFGALGVAAYFWRRARRPAAAQQRLSAEEQRRLQSILEEGEDSV